MVEADDDALEDRALNGRMCIVSRKSLPADSLIRFVVGPDGDIVPDLKRRLPGRGAHVEASRTAIETAVKRNLFRRAFKGEGRAGEGLAATVEALLARQALGALGLARKAGQLATGAAKVEAELRAGRAIALLQARDGAADGLRKMDGARRAAIASGRAREIPVFHPFDAVEMGLALGGANVVHAAVLAGSAGGALVRRLRLMQDFRGEDPEDAGRAQPDAAQAGAGTIENDGSSGDGARTDEAPGRLSGQEAEV